MKLPYILVALSLFFTCGSTTASSSPVDNYNLRTFTMNSGMANNNIDDLCRDSRGFLWIAYMGGGLERFDGYEFVSFDDLNSTGEQLRSSFVKSLAEDQAHRLWVGGEGGLDVIDLTTMSIVTPAGYEQEMEKIASENVTDLYFDSTGSLWISGRLAVYRVTFNNRHEIECVKTLPVPGAFYRGITVRDVEGNGNVWLGMGGSVMRVTADSNGNLVAKPVSPQLADLPEVEYFSSFYPKDGQVWISTNHGVYRYDTFSGKVKSYQHIAGDPTSLSQNFITDIAQSGNNPLVFSSLKGLNFYNPIDDNFERVDNGHSTPGSSFVNMMLAEPDNLYLGTEGGGLQIFSPRRLEVISIVHDDKLPGSLSPHPVNAITCTPSGTLFIGTVEGGLNIRRQGDKDFTHIIGNQLSHNSVSALSTDSNGRLWVGTWGGGIDVLRAAAPYDRLMQVNRETHPDYNISYVGTLTYDPVNDGMFIGANTGLMYYDISTGQLSNAIDTKGGAIDAYGFVGSAIDRDSILWLGSARGLLTVDLTRRNTADGTFECQFSRYLLDGSDDKIVEKPTSFYEGADGSMWIGTNGHGIYRVLPGTRGSEGREIVRYTTADGLANNTIRSILGDVNGHLWIATINGLSHFVPSTCHFNNYSTADGLPSDQFYWNAAYRDTTARGQLIFGTDKGVAVVTPVNETPRQGDSKVAFTRLKVGNRSISGSDGGYSPLDITYTPRVTIHERDKSIQVEFAALDFGNNDNALYRYRLKGFDKEWITTGGNHRVASYTNLSPGDYTLQVMYLPDGDDSTATVSELRITVKPYFYKSIWFLLIILILLVVIAIAVYRIRVRSLTKQREWLRQQVKKSTSQLADQNRQIQQLTVDRLTFFTNIIHEFRTPVTLITGPIERALRLSTNPKVIEQLNLVERNSKYLLSLINQLMDYRKIEAGKMGISYTHGNIKLFVEDVVAPFRIVARDRGIMVHTLFKLEGFTSVVFDEEAIRKIIINLLSNAIKYTPDNGTVTIYTACCHRPLPATESTDQPASEGTCYIGVSDTGNGIAANDIDHIFERFYQGESTLKYPLPGAGDSGIGLYLCRTIVEMHGGNISVRNNPTRGCTFRVLMPIPAIKPDDAKISVPSSRDKATDGEVNSPTPAHDTTILVVEDNTDMRQYISSILRDRYSVIEASNGAEALDILSRTNIDFIISDLMMPVMDGLELSKHIKENFAISHIPILMLTAKTATEPRIDSYRIGVDDYLVKPFDEAILLARIEGILLNRSRMQHNFSDSLDTATIEIAGESRDKKFIEQVMETLRDNYKNSYFEVGDFAEALGISRSLLNKKLQSLMGQSAGQLVRNYRLNLAREMIMKNRESKSMNISEIAYEVGFNDSKYFTRCFSRQFGVTPSSMLAGD